MVEPGNLKGVVFRTEHHFGTVTVCSGFSLFHHHRSGRSGLEDSHPIKPIVQADIIHLLTPAIKNPLKHLLALFSSKEYNHITSTFT